MSADRGDVIGLKHVVVHIVGIVAHVPLTGAPLSLDLIKQGDVLVELHESEEGDKFVHDWLLEVSLNSEHLLHVLHAEHLCLLLCELVVISHLDSEGVLIGVIVQIDEAVVEKETSVALLTV